MANNSRMLNGSGRRPLNNATLEKAYNKKLNDFFSEFLRKAIQKNYLKILTDSVEFLGRELDPRYDLIDKLEICMKK